MTRSRRPCDKTSHPVPEEVLRAARRARHDPRLGRGEVWTMPYVTCPTCGERGKIPSSLIGARIKCRKCGLSFQVSPPTTKAAGGGAAAPAAVGGAPGATAAATAGPTAAVELHGIEVEGLDASSWAVPTETAMNLKAEAETAAEAGHEVSGSFAPAPSSPAATREYKLLTSRDKAFEGKFDLARLE